MNSSQLYNLFRSDTGDNETPYLWTDEEVWAYTDSTYQDFVRLTGGIADFTSEATEVAAVAGEATAELHPKILRIMSARNELGREIEILNMTDLGRLSSRDYGRRTPYRLDDTQGEVYAMLIGMQRGLARWLDIPLTSQTIRLHIYRLPLTSITGPDQELLDVDDHHLLHLLVGMKARAYRKQDTETFAYEKASENEILFERYCAKVRAEFEREKHKHRTTTYGGL